MRLLIVIVNYRTPDLTVAALASIEAEVRSLPGTHVVVTDNLSPDDSVAKLREAIERRGWGDWCQLMPLPKNGGFAYGNNEGIRPFLDRHDAPRFVLLLNPDTVARPGAIGALLDHMERHHDQGIAGSRLEDPDGTPQRSAFRFHGILSEFEHGMRLGPVTRLLGKFVVAPPVSDVPCETDWVAGASMIVRKEVFDTIGLLDEAYFMYYEEVDFCLRARRAGFKCGYAPASRVVHLVGQASGVTDKAKANKRRPQYWFDSRRRYFVKNYGRVYALLADTALAVAFATWRVRRRLQRKPDLDPERMLPDLLRNSALLRS